MKKHHIAIILFGLLGISFFNFCGRIFDYAGHVGGAIGGVLVVMAAGTPFMISLVLSIMAVIYFLRAEGWEKEYKISRSMSCVSFLSAVAMTFILSYDITEMGLKLMLPLFLATLLTFCVVLVYTPAENKNSIKDNETP